MQANQVHEVQRNQVHEVKINQVQEVKIDQVYRVQTNHVHEVQTNQVHQVQTNKVQTVFNLMEKSTAVVSDLEVLDILDLGPGNDSQYVSVPYLNNVTELKLNYITIYNI